MNRRIQILFLLALSVYDIPAFAQLSVGGQLETKRVPPPPKRVVEEVRAYRLAKALAGIERVS